MSLLAWILAAIPAAPDALAERLDRAVERAARGDVRLGVAIYDLGAGRVIYERNADEPLIPASNAKLFIAAAALDRLGPEFQFVTTVRRDGQTLRIESGGDPNISGRFHGGDPCAIFRDWARRLSEAGVRSLGRIVLHNGLFDREYRHPDWSRHNPAAWYAAPVGAFSLNDNCVDLTVRPGQVGGPAEASLSPPTTYLRLLNRTTTVEREPPAAEAVVWHREPGARTIVLSRSVWARAPPATWSVAVDDPTEYFATVLVETLQAEGIRLEGPVEESDVRPAPGGEIAVVRSPLDLTLRVCLARSQNFYAEMLFKRLGAEHGGIGSFETGAAAVRAFAATIGATATELVDGSGLSRRNRTTARDIVRLLAAMDRHPAREVFRSALAASGDEEGTLRRRLDGPRTRGRVRAKTGTLAGVCALSGYAETAAGRRFAFSILLNGRAASEAACDRIVEALFDP